MHNIKKWLFSCLLILMLTACGSEHASDGVALTNETTTETPTNAGESNQRNKQGYTSDYRFSYADVPAYSDEPYYILNDNVPVFSEEDFTTVSFESYSPLDALGRCGVAFANIGRDIMPTEKRGSIGHVKPSGWQTVKFDCVEGNYLYNRSHMIAYQLTGENDNTGNLITGTRYFNAHTMQLFENLVADYVKETENHVLYRVTPVFVEDELVARGVQMEAMSVEDYGESVQYNVFCYNIQPGIVIDYKTGDAKLAENTTKQVSDQAKASYVANTNSKKFHKPDCQSAVQMNKENKWEFNGNREELIAQGYEPCKSCKP